jgi:hypothetical protein
MPSFDELRREAQRLGTNGFAAAYPDAVLILRDAPAATGQSTDASVQTSIPSQRRVDTRVDDMGLGTRIAPPSDAFNPQAAFANDDDRSPASVYFVQKSERNPFKTMITIGRAQNNDIVLPVSLVSKFHAYITKVGEAHFIHDQGSTNGTIVDGKRVVKAEPMRLHDGARIELAPGVVLRFHTAAGLYGALMVG